MRSSLRRAGRGPAEFSGVRQRACDHGAMSRRDLVHVLNALADAARAEAGVGVPVTVVDEAVGRSGGDLRTVLNLQSLEADGLVEQTGDGAWALTAAGVQRLRDDDELSGGR
jgi:hypothetical protein